MLYVTSEKYLYSLNIWIANKFWPWELPTADTKYMLLSVEFDFIN